MHLHVDRRLHADDILITDDSGPISLAGTMGGLATEIDDDSTDIVIEGAHFSDTGIATIGMIAGRQPCRNTSTTMTTRNIAS